VSWLVKGGECQAEELCLFYLGCVEKCFPDSGGCLLAVGSEYRAKSGRFLLVSFPLVCRQPGSPMLRNWFILRIQAAKEDGEPVCAYRVVAVCLASTFYRAHGFYLFFLLIF